jgi:hypothetical protein
VDSQLELFTSRQPRSRLEVDDFLDVLASFSWQGRSTTIGELEWNDQRLPVFTNEFWTSQQRAAHSLHEISYRACFKPQLPAFFIDRLSARGDVVFDPFAGRGTTMLEAALRERVPNGCDVNPLSRALILPRLAPPALAAVADRLQRLNLTWSAEIPHELLAFYHPTTLRAICAVRKYLIDRESSRTFDDLDAWIRMVTLNRLTGHSRGFLSVYTLPPNQATSVKAQQRINAKRAQSPPPRDLRATVLRKSAALLADVDATVSVRLQRARQQSRFRVGSCTDEFWEREAVQLIVTSPPFLDVVDYASDNWLRCWFCGVSADDVPMAMHSSVDAWKGFVEAAFRQFSRLLRPGGYVAFEVGEVRHGAIRLEQFVVPAGAAAGLSPVAILVNEQAFTKTANIWGVTNNRRGTNTNRIVVFQQSA